VFDVDYLQHPIILSDFQETESLQKFHKKIIGSSPRASFY